VSEVPSLVCFAPLFFFCFFRRHPQETVELILLSSTGLLSIVVCLRIPRSVVGYAFFLPAQLFCLPVNTNPPFFSCGLV
jgi:hypothetical protein